MSNTFCITEELGDGICQDYNNGPFCDYDLGDCFAINSNLDECCNCKTSFTDSNPPPMIDFNDFPYMMLIYGYGR